MKFNRRQIILLLLVFYIGLAVTGILMLAQFKTDVIFKLKLSKEFFEDSLGSDFNKVIAIVIFTSVAGLIGFIWSFRLVRNQQDFVDEDFEENEDFTIDPKKEEAEVEEKFDQKGLLMDVETIIKSSETIRELSNGVISALAQKLEACQGGFYVTDKDTEGNKSIKLAGAYAYFTSESKDVTFDFGEGLAGQVAKAKHVVNLTNVPEGYIKVLSGLGESKPASLLIVPVLKDKKTLAVIELASFEKFNSGQEEAVSEAARLIATELQKRIKVEKKKDDKK